MLKLLLTAALILGPTDDPTRPAGVWKPNTHVFAANLALKDALGDGHVTIPPYGEFAVPADVLRAIRGYPADYRAGVIGPDVFPDVYAGQSFAHVDHSGDQEKWTSDNWLRHLFRQAHAESESGPKRDRSLAFAYGYLTHAAGDMFGHTYVNAKAGGIWDFARMDVVSRHVVLEGYIGKHTPATESTIAVWERFVAEALIKHPAPRAHMKGAVHYKRFLALHDWLGPALEQAVDSMKNGVRDGATYGEQCLANPIWCGRKEFLETWDRDVDEGLRALVGANREVGEAIMENDLPAVMSALTRWQTDWLPKILGAHAPAEVAKWIRENNPLTPLTAPIKKEIVEWLADEFAREIAIIKKMMDPASYMDDLFSPAVRAQIDQDLALAPSGLLNWQEFTPLYNTVILSKLVLLDGRGLNELARRAGVAAPLYPEDRLTNILLGVVKSMDGNDQWTGGNYGLPYQPYQPPAAAQRRKDGRITVATAGQRLTTRAASGFAFWGNQEAREKVFGRIFKGYGPGPGRSLPPGADVLTPPARRDTATPTITRPIPGVITRPRRR
jgi:hypothetical protein